MMKALDGVKTKWAHPPLIEEDKALKKNQSIRVGGPSQEAASEFNDSPKRKGPPKIVVGAVMTINGWPFICRKVTKKDIVLRPVKPKEKT